MRRIRDHVQHPVPGEYFDQRLSAGWKLKAIEWESAEGEETPKPGLQSAAIPFGYEISADGVRLEANRHEMAVLLLILEMTVVEKSVSRIAEELNLRGHKTRAGTAWTPTAVFNLLPRLIEAGPELLKSSDWGKRRPQLPTQAEGGPR